MIMLFIFQEIRGHQYAFDQNEHLWASNSGTYSLTCPVCGHAENKGGWLHVGPRLELSRLRGFDFFVCDDEVHVTDAKNDYGFNENIGIVPIFGTDEDEYADDDW